ncbi:outer membrane protein [Methylocystis bryophila]|uniref:Outer membrane protein beta-barrel domain-containing protein n=1 Tax=Methylocystis bryophila TaxID=655015 RepID=A0A1W6MUP5_9HYPH|nr:outer membrane beta-barrel protein [Methylocystis bryophila]ARN81338.1 hypothetical protein B1812_09915 [Methylocystis bryophila]BDV37321.1 hypothetical protein DSM21852_05740 [Methylocystis bryophila]
MKMPASNLPFAPAALAPNLRKSGFCSLLLASALVCASPSAQAADLALPALKDAPVFKAPLPFELEFGARYFYSTGYYRGDLFDAEQTAAKVSRLTYGNLDAHAAESFFRLDHETGLFLKGYLGGGSIVGGHLSDEDFPPHVHDEGEASPYSKTVDPQSGGSLQYGSIDAGFNLLRTSQFRVGPFVGYHYFRERMNSFGCVQVAFDPETCLLHPTPSTLDVLDEDARWHSLRLGLSGRVVVMPGLNFDAEVAWAHNWLKGADYHNLRPEIWGARDDGDGNGFQAEALLSYDLTRALSVGVGGRYWYFDGGSGLTHWERTPKGGAPAPQRAVSERYGMFVQTAYKLGGAEAAAAPFGGFSAPRTAAEDWAGFYLGPNVGYGTGASTAYFAPITPGAFDLAAAGNAPGSQSFSSAGFVGGGQLGYNYPLSRNALLGVETDFDYAHIGGSQGYDYFGHNVSSMQRAQWLGTTRLRLGWLPGAGALMLYATGGLAYGGVTASAGVQDGSQYMYGQMSSASLGWALGGGAELAVAPNVTLRVEYLHVDLGKRAFVMRDYGASSAEEAEDEEEQEEELQHATAFHVRTRAQSNLVRLGVTYHLDLFNPETAPVLASY